ncbi:MAG: hypothetical protein HQ465_21870, partial [Rhodospirillales bacterium]|nr:hypothetical protein [Rhodospirillales bacterium]
MLLRPRQKTFVERSLHALGEHGNTLGVAPTGCHAPGTPILMFDGSIRKVETIQVGEVVMGPDSQPRHVFELHRGVDRMIEIRPIKGKPFVVNEGHILTLVRTNQGNKKRAFDYDGALIDISIGDWMAASASFRHMHKLLRLPADFPEREEPALDPYLVGILIGDGCTLNNVSVTTPDAEIAEVLYAHAEYLGLGVRVDQLPNNAANSYHLIGRRGRGNVLIDALRELGIFGKRSAEKFLPDVFRLGSRETRLAVLAGLIDTDGHLCTNGCFEFSSHSQRLAEDVAFLSRSLGLMANVADKEVNGELYWRVHISGFIEKIPTRVLRKQAAPRRQKK